MKLKLNNGNGLLKLEYLMILLSRLKRVGKEFKSNHVLQNPGPLKLKICSRPKLSLRRLVPPHWWTCWRRQPDLDLLVQWRQLWRQPPPSGRPGGHMGPAQDDYSSTFSYPFHRNVLDMADLWTAGNRDSRDTLSLIRRPPDHPETRARVFLRQRRVHAGVPLVQWGETDRALIGQTGQTETQKAAGQPDGWTASHYYSLWFWRNSTFLTSQEEETMLTDYDNEKRNLLYQHASINCLFKDLYLDIVIQPDPKN